MEIEITRKESMPLLKRTEVEGRLTYQGATPSRKEVAAAVSKAMKAKQEVVIIRKVETKYGEQASTVKAYVYDDRKALEVLERDFAIRKNTFEEKKEAPAGEAKPAEAAAEGDAPAEDKPTESEAPAPQEKAEEKPPEKPKEKKEEPKAEPAKEAPAEKPAEEKKEGDA